MSFCESRGFFHFSFSFFACKPDPVSVMMTGFHPSSPCQSRAMRRIRRDSKTLLQDLFYRGVHAGDRDTPVSVQPARSSPVFDILLWVDWKNKTAACLPHRSQHSLAKTPNWSTPSPVWSGQRANSSSWRTLTLWRSTRSGSEQLLWCMQNNKNNARIQKITFFDSIHFKKSLHGSHGKTWHNAFFSFFNANNPPPICLCFHNTAEWLSGSF